MSDWSTPIVCGNWKMHQGPVATREFFAAFLEAFTGRERGTVAFFPPAVSLAAARDALTARPEIQLGVQNVHWEEKGAFTGEISAPLAAEAGAALVLVGHSERRHVFGETFEQTARKTQAALAASLTPMLCVGETLEERERGEAGAVVEAQLSAVFDSLPADTARRILIAYEPVWAIGTGKTASPADAEEMHGRVRAFLTARYGDAAARIPILYGGSVKPENAEGLLAVRDVDGLLVGGASLDAGGFARICLTAA